MKRLSSILSTHAISSIIFDFDETITTLNVDWETFLIELSKTVDSIEKNSWQILSDQGYHPVQIYSYICKKHGKKARDALHNSWALWEQKLYRGNHVPHKQLVQFIRSNHKKTRMHVWTLNTEIFVDRFLRELKIDTCFQKIVTRDDVFLPKPDIEGFTLIFNPKKERKEEYLYIGDSVWDEQAAKNAGIRFLNVADI